VGGVCCRVLGVAAQDGHGDGGFQSQVVPAVVQNGDVNVGAPVAPIPAALAVDDEAIGP